MQTSRLWIIGTPLSEGTFLSEGVLDLLERSLLIIAESPKVARRWASKRKTLDQKNWFYLDGMKPAEEKLLSLELQKCRKAGGDVALFSDGGMPILFDPGEAVLRQCRELQFRIRTLPGATSWATACAVSGWEPPFLIQGFPPRKTEERESYLQHLVRRQEAIVLMDTPYRFEALLDQVCKAFPPTRHLFIAWEIATDSEKYIWSTVSKIQGICEKEQMKKGEFVLIVGKH